MPPRDPARDERLVQGLCRWFQSAARDLPWRQTDESGRRDPYRSLVSEFMLQQTQVARVLEKFTPFIARFPTLETLARADEDDVLAMWSGLGYYRRARSLHHCAREAFQSFAQVPKGVGELMSLKGIGRYTAGAIASIVHDEAAPIVDGNVERVLLRLEGLPLRAGESQTRDLCWSRAEELVSEAAKSRAKGVRPGVFNEALMELGALVCTPKSPKCPACPLRGDCRAAEAGTQGTIPAPKVRKAKKALYLACAVARDPDGRVLIAQRPKGGLWGGLWEVPGVESDAPVPIEALAERMGVATEDLARHNGFVFETTHRSVRVEVYRAARAGTVPGSRWAGTDDFASLATGSLQERVLASLGTEAEPA